MDNCSSTGTLAAVYQILAKQNMVLIYFVVGMLSHDSGTRYIIKIKIRLSCEIEDFVKTHLCELCVIRRSRVLRVVCPHEGYRSATPLGTTV